MWSFLRGLRGSLGGISYLVLVVFKEDLKSLHFDFTLYLLSSSF